MAVLNEIEIDGILYTLFDINKIYPVGSIYMSTSSTNPSNIFGGTWEQIIDRVLIGAGNSYGGGTTGGSTTHTHTNPTTGSTSLSVSQIPSHNHSFSATTSSNGGHGHQLRYSGSGNTGYLPNGSEAGTLINYSGNTPGQNGIFQDRAGSGYTGNFPALQSVGGHTHTISGTSGSTGSGSGHSHSIGNTGSSSNMMPYLAVYMWKRTA